MDNNGTKGKVKEEIKRQVAYSLWYIWKERNGALFEGRQPRPFGVIRRINKAISEFNMLGKRMYMSPMNKQQEDEMHIHAKCAAPGVIKLKINCDAAWNTKSGKAGVGAMAQDYLKNV